MFLWVSAIFRVIHVSRSTGTQYTYHYSDINTPQLHNRLSVVVIVLVKLECMMDSLGIDRYSASKVCMTASLACGATALVSTDYRPV